MVELDPLPSAISELFAQVSASGKLTLADRYGILAVLLRESISAEELCCEELHCIDRLLYALRKGRVQVTPDLSSVL